MTSAPVDATSYKATNSSSTSNFLLTHLRQTTSCITFDMPVVSSAINEKNDALYRLTAICCRTHKAVAFIILFCLSPVCVFVCLTMNPVNKFVIIFSTEINYLYEIRITSLLTVTVKGKTLLCKEVSIRQ